jgi:hypothetical protein
MTWPRRLVADGRQRRRFGSRDQSAVLSRAPPARHDGRDRMIPPIAAHRRRGTLFWPSPWSVANDISLAVGDGSRRMTMPNWSGDIRGHGRAPYPPPSLGAATRQRWDRPGASPPDRDQPGKYSTTAQSRPAFCMARLGRPASTPYVFLNFRSRRPEKNIPLVYTWPARVAGRDTGLLSARPASLTTSVSEHANG